MDEIIDYLLLSLSTTLEKEIPYAELKSKYGADREAVKSAIYYAQSLQIMEFRGNSLNYAILLNPISTDIKNYGTWAEYKNKDKIKERKDIKIRIMPIVLSALGIVVTGYFAYRKEVSDIENRNLQNQVDSLKIELRQYKRQTKIDASVSPAKEILTAPAQQKPISKSDN